MSNKTEKANLSELIQKIEKLTRERMKKSEVIAISDLRNKPKSKTILFVEDDETVRGAIKKVLERANYNVITASSSQELSNLLDRFSFDLILMDIGLPWINGFELAQLIKENNSLKHLPLVFMSADGDVASMRKGFQLGADDYLKKPVGNEELLRSINTLFKLRE